MISELQKKLSNLEKENKNNTSNTIKISNEKEALKKEYKIIVSKNMKLSDLVKNLESIIKSLEDEIKIQKGEIENLKDIISHHYRLLFVFFSVNIGLFKSTSPNSYFIFFGNFLFFYKVFRIISISYCPS